MKSFLGATFFVVFGSVFGLAQSPNTSLKSASGKGEFYFSWGYNREFYSRSNIRFRNTTTDNYDFVVMNAHAHQSPDMKEFWKIPRLTIPQYQMNGGYFFKKGRGWGVELSWDHLKYIMDDYQTARVRGNIRGQDIDKDTLITPDFVHLQHTNGNNYLMLSAVKKWPLWQGKHLSLDAIAKLGGGTMISYTISTVLGNTDPGHFHAQGWVVGTNAGLRLNIYRRFFVQGEGQAAFANYTGSELGQDRVGRATHHFFSWAYMYRVGVRLPL
jgi:hypothetical protein